jgi:RNA polymerase sigma factor (sigma-70 family)
MRLVRYESSPKPTALVVGEAPPLPWATSYELERSFAEAYLRLQGALLDHAERFLSREDAEDAVADAWASLWPRWASLDDERRSDRYFFGVVHNCIRAKQREKRHEVSIDDASVELDQQSMNAAFADLGGLTDDQAEVLDAALAIMSPKRREIFLLIREQDFSHAETAEMLGLKQGTINHQMHLATRQLRAAFARAGFKFPGRQIRGLLSSPKEMGLASND